MNSCEYYQELISRLVDGEISREEHEALMAHMNTCSRCNAMYAVFHDLSDILSEESEPLPEGLHENIMAGVRRSEMMRKNRRMRSFGLRTAMTAAACALLVLFAASGFGPGKRVEDVSLRTQEATEQLYQAPAMQTVPAPTEDTFSIPVQMPAPTPVWTAAPAETFTAPAAPDAYLTAGSGVNETQNTLQPEQYYPYQYDQNTPAPVTVQDFELFTVQTPAPAAVQNSTPAVFETPAPAAVQNNAPAVFENAEAPVLSNAAPMLADSRDTASDSAATNADTMPGSDAPFVMMKAAPAPYDGEAAVSNAADDEPAEKTLFSGLDAEFASDRQEEMNEEAGAGDAAQSQLLADSTVSDPDSMEPTPNAAAEPLPEVNGEQDAEPVGEKAEMIVEEQSVTLYGKAARDRLLALLGDSESELPGEAELTRVVHVTLRPDDAYSGEEKLDVSIYGDFVYYSLYPEGSGPVNYRAACALRDLDGLLKELTAPEAAASQPSPTPTADPYAAEAATPKPVGQ